MKNSKLSCFLLGSLICATFAQANTPLLVSPDLSNPTDWNVGANLFAPEWVEFATLDVPSRVTLSSTGATFTSYDDGESDRIETYLYQEFYAGPATSAWPTIFEEGDVIVFKGSASAVRTGADTSDMIVRAFIKVLGYNEMGWEFQTKEMYSDFHVIGSSLEDFELSVTYPDITADDSLQVLQIGFEISTEYDGTNMDSGSIYFENLEGYLEGEVVGKPVETWYEDEVLGMIYNFDQVWSYTEAMGYLYTGLEGWVNHIEHGWFIEISGSVTEGSWMYSEAYGIVWFDMANEGAFCAVETGVWYTFADSE